MRFVAVAFLALVASACASAELARPHFHLTATDGWINDPNGLVQVDEQWWTHHQFTRSWPLIPLRWGRASLVELAYLRRLPPPAWRPALPSQQVWSGGAVKTDECPTCVAAMYTSAGLPGTFQNQRIRTSTDPAGTWSDSTEVIGARGVFTAFRDPKIMTDGTGYLAPVAAGGRVEVFSGTDLKTWSEQPIFVYPPVGRTRPAGIPDGVWECPDIIPFTLEGEQLYWLKFDTSDAWSGLPFSREPDKATLRATARTVVLDKDESGAFVIKQPTPLTVDHGADFYAAITYDARDARNVWLGWMANWWYAPHLPNYVPLFDGGGTAAGVLSAPREITAVRHDGVIRMIQQPVAELACLRTNASETLTFDLDDDEKRLKTRAASFELEAEIELADGARAGFDVRTSGSDRTRVVFERDGTRLITRVDRSRSGTRQDEVERALRVFEGVTVPFGAVHSTVMWRTGTAVKLKLLVDTSTLEVFAGVDQIGEVTFSEIILPDDDAQGIEAFSSGSAKFKSVKVWPVKSNSAAGRNLEALDCRP